MNCCTNCFESSYINAIILGNKTKGNCDYCKSEDVSIYEASELNPFFLGIIDLYEVNYANGKSLESQIIMDFHKKVFSQKLIDTNNIKQLIAEIIKDDIADYQSVLENPVWLRFHNTGAEEDVTQPLFLSWDNFSEEIKTVNRFHFVNALDLEKLKSLFKHFQKDYKKGKKFYRARISNNPQGFPIEEMGNPPNNLAKSGRANPNGISYLYIANDITTTLYEARASLFDYVSVGTFKLEDDISVVNLSRSTYDVFRLAELESLEEVMIHGSFIDKLEEELSKPRRKNDSELDYLPTQYLSELIKSMGFDGIEFRSSLYSEGYNVAIFYPEKFKCLEANVYDIENINLQYTRVNNE
jgi:hypothetical protein